MKTFDTVIVGGGVAGLTAGLFTSRAGLETRVINYGSSILNRNAHLENFPGFPAGISPRLFLELLEEQLRNNGGELEQGRVKRIQRSESNFVVSYKNREIRSSNVICASWSDVSYLNDLNVKTIDNDNKTFLETDRWGRTSIEGLYAAGRIAGVYHQAIVSAGHGAMTGITVLEDSDTEFYHDWVTPTGYFTDRDRDVPAGCEEIPEREWQNRSRSGKEVLMSFLSTEFENQPDPHPSKQDDHEN